MSLAKLKEFPFHLFLFALYPFLALYASNQTVVGISETVRPFSLMLGIVVLGYLVIRISKLEMNKAAAFLAFTLILLMSYGHVYSVIKGAAVLGFTVGRHRYLILAWALTLLIAGLLLARKTRNGKALTRNLNVIAVLAILIPLFSIAFFQLLNLKDEAKAGTLATPQTTRTLAWDELPDVYYIILDGYAREDILRDQYGFDNSGFTGFLREQGFYVADNSASNYMWTMYSLSSSLNMQYAQDLGVRMSPSPHHYGFFEKIKHSLVRSKFEDMGYSTIAFATGWDGSEMISADYYLTPEESILSQVRTSGAFNNFESMLIYNSLFRIIFDFDHLLNTRFGLYITEKMEHAFDVKRAIINAIFDNLEKVPQIPEPKFVFAHVVAPHRPYIFGPNGEAVYSPQPYTLSDLDNLPGDEEGVQYLAQLTYITTRTQETIANILANSDRPVIIILLSDHGPMVGLDWEHPTREGIEARMAILSAFYTPEACQEFFYPTITPVNIFRIIFQCVYGEPYDLLGDRTFINKEGITSGFTPVDELWSEIE
jgi:hypothetical protein